MTRFVQKNSGYIIIYILSLLPIVFWSLGDTFPYKFSTLWTSMTSIGQIVGLIGMILFAISLMLSIRVRWLEPLFGGMNNVYTAHHITGGIGFLLLLIHPILLATAYIEASWKEAALYLLPGEDWAINLGIIALLCLMALLILTYYVNLPYQFWKFTHKFMGVAFITGGIHAFFVTSDISNNLYLRNYMLGITILGLISYTYRTLLGKFLIPRYTYQIISVKKLNEVLTEIIMIPQNKEMQFRPGQFIFIQFLNENLSREVHPFSISNAPGGKSVRISVKALGDFTTLFPNIPKGSLVKIEGPYGKFTPQQTSRKQIWIAGGIGITPFVSMAASLAQQQISVDLYYIVKTQSEAVYLEELQQLAGINQGFHVYLNISSTNGRLTAETIQQTSGDLSQTDIYVCGPPSMMISMKKQLKSLGVSKDHIHSEEFDMN